MGEKQEALLVIDAQVGPLWGTYKQEETFSVIQQTITKAENAKVPIFYVQFEGASTDPMANGSMFWQFEPGIYPREQDMIIPKKAADSFFQTKLLGQLYKRNVTDLVIVGVRTDYCIDTTCRAALSLGFNVTLVKDGHTTVDGCIPAKQIIDHHNGNLGKLSTPGHHITVLSSDEIIF